MFTERDLSGELATIRDQHVPEAVVFETARDFDVLDPAVAEQLGLRADALSPLAYDPAWVPGTAPEVLTRLVSDAFTIGAPGDGGVTWTRQTEPPFVFVKPRLEGSPSGFVNFLIGAALVEAGTELPEHFLGFFREQYPDLAAATPLSPSETYQLANALYEAYVGLHTRDTFIEWADDAPDLYKQWIDAGDRLRPRLDGLAREVATSDTGFAEAAELACGAIRHATEEGPTLPTPFAALNTTAYRHHGADYAVEWARKTFEELE